MNAVQKKTWLRSMGFTNKNHVTWHMYLGFTNQEKLAKAGFKSNERLTFGQIHKKGYLLRKGSKWVSIFYRQVREHRDPVTGEVKEDVNYKTFKVFNIDQVDTKPPVPNRG